MNQIALPLAWPADEDPHEFIVTASNSSAVDHLDHWGSWPVKATILVGPRKSGRSLLARIFAAKSGGRMIDEAQLRPEAQLFHAWNEAQSGAGPLLIVADDAPPVWKVRLPDLRSRLAATPVVALGPPDDVLISTLFTKLLERRGIPVPAEAASYIASRIERTHIAILRAADIVNEASLSQKRPITLPFVRDVLIAHGMIDRPQANSGEGLHDESEAS